MSKTNLKILLIGPCLYGDGISIVLFTLYQSLIKSGHTCDVALSHKPASSAPQTQCLVANGSQCFCLPRLSKQGPFAFAKSLYKICRENHYDVIHIHTGLFIWLAAWVGKKAQVPVRIGHAHGFEYGNKYTRPFLRVLSPLFTFLNRKYCTNLICCNQRSAKVTFGVEATWFQNYILPETLNNFSPELIQQKRQELILDNKAVIFGFIGAFYPTKRIPFFLDIIYELRQKGCNAYGIVIGDGTEADLVKEKWHQLNLEKYVLLMGHRTDTRLLVQTFDYYLSASVVEGMSVSMIEAQLAGKPCFVSSKILNYSDLQIGLFTNISGQTPSAWATDILQAIDRGLKPIDREKAQTMADEKGFSEKKAISQLIKIYTENL